MELSAQHFAVPVSKKTPEWGWLEYLLQVSCQTSKIRMRAGWSVANKRLAVEFETRCRNLLQLHAWVPVSELPPHESVQEICRNGFKSGHAGVSFHIGNVQLPGLYRDGRDVQGNERGFGVRSRGRTLPAGRRLYEFLLCRVGTGRSLLIDSAKQTETVTLPPEYDSFFVNYGPSNEQAIDEAYPGVLPRHLLHHEYIVRDPSQALPLYLVHFEYDPEMHDRLALPLCDNCGLQAALLYCEADDAVLCRACDAKIHSSHSIACRHVRVEVNRRPENPNGSCPEHPEQDADQYCAECRTPVCSLCRSLGSHSSGQAAKHKLIPLFEAYQHALQHSKAGSDGSAPARQKIEAKLVAELDGRLVAVREQTQELEDKIYDHIQQAVKHGQELAEEQASLFLADELEAKRQLEYSSWIESFMEEQVKQQPPAEFLESWLQHCRVREEAFSLGALAKPRASASLRLEGGLRLHAEDASVPAALRGNRTRGPHDSESAMYTSTPKRFILDA
eukprot:TRINITY_DN35585_c0_g1_i2.p1 TRINITY_DN35585_c0_g1~~TRINITY_DN35585_c0_g1_i2.p1  ORF type:complete len:504 (+),score=94.51 TRINITY_DN35585_c0_g1_i2:126-1637(+)